MNKNDKIKLAIVSLANKKYDEIKNSLAFNVQRNQDKQLDALNRSVFVIGFQKAVAMASDKTLIAEIEKEMKK